MVGLCSGRPFECTCIGFSYIYKVGIQFSKTFKLSSEISYRVRRLETDGFLKIAIINAIKDISEAPTFSFTLITDAYIVREECNKIRISAKSTDYLTCRLMGPGRMGVLRTGVGSLKISLFLQLRRLQRNNPGTCFQGYLKKMKNSRTNSFQSYQVHVTLLITDFWWRSLLNL